ncbi:hypothetical protein HYU19_00130 [Candidatus Woesearchaeota archaeon]|nr:hypothetical protein [Candidatus Woesearchaeota archaeon]
MMRQKKTLQILNAKDLRGIFKLLESQWGIRESTLKKRFERYALLMNAKKKIYLVTKEISRIDLSQLRVDSLGIYFGENHNANELRLSIEGSQLLGGLAAKNVLSLAKEQMRQWLKGEDLELSAIPAAGDGKGLDGGNGFVLVKWENDFLGSGKCKDGKLWNYIPKTRRITAED